MMKDFVRLVACDRNRNNRTNVRVSVESHLMALATEESRRLGKTIDFDVPEAEERIFGNVQKNPSLYPEITSLQKGQLGNRLEF